MHVVIIGAGIGGLSTAIALQQAGIDYTLYEKSPQLRTAGAGISLWPNATRILRRFGVLDELLAQGDRIFQTRICTESGKALTGLDLTAFEDPALCIQRSGLQQILRSQLSDHRVFLDHALTQVETQGDQVIAHFHNQTCVAADCLIAADGIHSGVRSRLWNAPAPRYQGYVAWRGFVQRPLPHWTTGLALQLWGRGQRVGLLTMGQGKMYWFASINSQTPSADAQIELKKDYLLALFQDWHPSVSEILTLTEENDVMVNPVEACGSSYPYHQGPVALLGDSAHGMTPNLGQGACMAIEDAACLAGLLTDSRSGSSAVSEALAQYSQSRWQRVEKVRLRSYGLGVLGQLSNPVLVEMRALALRFLPKTVTQFTFQSLFAKYS